MKKHTFFLVLLCFLSLAGCSETKQISGKVVVPDPGGDLGPDSLLLQTDEGETLRVLVTNETKISSPEPDYTLEDIRAEARMGLVVSFSYVDAPQTCTTKSGAEIPTYTATRLSVLPAKTDTAFTLSDGTQVELWTGTDAARYRSADGTDLLVEHNVPGPDRAYTGGVEHFDGLPETAKSKVLAFYEAQGLLYDVPALLENAYANHLETLEKDDPAEFHTHLVEQETIPSASSPQVLYFMTTVSQPLGDGSGTLLDLGAAFDRETGAHIPAWDLFSCDTQTVKQTLPDLADISEAPLRAEMETALKPEYIVMHSECLEICFPHDALPSQDYGYGIALYFDEALCAILQDWTIPQEAA